MKRFILIACAVSVSACARMDIAVNWADTFIAGRVDDYFDISSEQSKNLKKSLQGDFKKIKSDVLPQWINSAKQLEKDVANNVLDEHKVNTAFDLVMKNVEHFTSHFSKTAVDFIASTDGEQLSYFQKSFKEKNEDDLKDIQSRKYEKNQKKRYFKYFEMFIGDLSDEQTALIEKHLKESPYPAELKIKNREHVFHVFMQKRTQPEELKNFVARFSQQPDAYNLPEYNEAVKNYQARLKSLLTRVLTTLSPKQKKELCDNLLKKVAQLEKIRGRS
ncbi:DUF6279 family lipoprotein [Bdellovibrio sp. HCB117]|uniref:DUF6279 family lipoprotein n=1 Tax=Bdellovibrio sp. HCB117 TaxID=3394359 RepID=UPI0039B5272B